MAATIDASASIGVLTGAVKNGKLNLNVGMDVFKGASSNGNEMVVGNSAPTTPRAWRALVTQATLAVVLPLSLGLASGQSLGDSVVLSITDDNLFDKFAPKVTVPSLPELSKLLGFDDLTPKALHSLFRNIHVCDLYLYLYCIL